MTVSINTYNNVVNNDFKVANKEDAMDKDAFLQILVTQLRNQDPLDPQDNDAFVAQMTRFSTLEQITNTNDKLEEMYKLILELKGEKNV